MTDDRQPRATPAFRQAGVGQLVTRSCMGCNKAKTVAGSTGSGLRWRCAGCSTQRMKEAA